MPESELTTHDCAWRTFLGAWRLQKTRFGTIDCTDLALGALWAKRQ